jgi:Tol biopolymer transport system component
MKLIQTAPRPRSLFALAIAMLLAVIAAAPAQAAFPGTPGPIAYPKGLLSDSTGDTGGIFTHGPRLHDHATQLTEDSTDSSPSYSADGRQIVFASDRDPSLFNGTHIFVMDADGSHIRQVTSGEGYDANPSFSPSGRQVVFDHRVNGVSPPHIYVINVDGTGLRQLTEGSQKDYDPTFAPNGKWIAFVSNREPDVRTDRADIFAMRADGSRLRMLVDGPRNEEEPDISPNGREVAFSSNRDHGHGPNIFVAKVSGRHVRELTHIHGDCFRTACYISPSWAPDGKHIACLRDGRYSRDLEVMRPDGGNRTEFASSGTEEEGFGSTLGAPGWGPAP